MKVKVQKSNSVEMNIPTFFMIKDRTSSYFKIIGEQSVLMVNDYPFVDAFQLGSSVQIFSPTWLIKHDSVIIPITEETFQDSLDRVTSQFKNL